MDLESITQLLLEAEKIYNDPCPNSYPKFIEWVNNFDNSDDYHKKIVGEIFNFISEKNKNPGTVVFEIDNIRKKEILDYLSKNLLL